MNRSKVLISLLFLATSVFAGPSIPGARFTDTLEMQTNAITLAASMSMADTNSSSTLAWNGDEDIQAFEYTHPDGGTVTINGEIYRMWKNKGASTITNGQPVVITGGAGRVASVMLADADDDERNTVIGVYTGEDPLAPDEIGRITKFGDVKGFDLAALTIEGAVSEGADIYLSTTRGMYSTSAPAAPAETVWIGQCTYAHAPSDTYDMAVSPARIKTWAQLDARFVQPTDLGDIAWSNATDFAAASITNNIEALEAGTNLWNASIQPEDLGTAAYSNATDFAAASIANNMAALEAGTNLWNASIQSEDLGTAAYSNATDFVLSSEDNLTAWDSGEGGLLVEDVPQSADGYISKLSVPTAFGSAYGVWHFDGNVNNAVAPSTPAPDTWQPVYAAGKFGQSINLGWAGNIKVFPQNNFPAINQDTDFAVEWWMSFATSSPDFYIFLNRADGYIFHIDEYYIKIMEADDPRTITHGLSWTSQRFYHVSCNYDADQHVFSFYRDGLEIGTFAGVNVPFSWLYNVSADEFRIVGSGGSGMKVDDLVIKIGEDSIRTGEFTPPTVAYGSAVPTPRIAASSLTVDQVETAVGLATTALQTNDVGSAAYVETNAFVSASVTNRTAFGEGAVAAAGAFAGGEGSFADEGAGAVGEGAYAAGGGFAGGLWAYAESTGGAVGSYASSSGSGFAGGNNATEVNDGGAVGSYASSTGGGLAGGDGATENAGGGAVGYYATASSGGAVGNSAVESGGGFAGGDGSLTQSGGGAIGSNTVSIAGGFAGGKNAQTQSGGGAAVGENSMSQQGGFAGGNSAMSMGGGVSIGKSSFTGPNSIQLGTGTNNIPGTFQVYSWPLLDADGKIPLARLDGITTNFAGLVIVNGLITGTY